MKAGGSGLPLSGASLPCLQRLGLGTVEWVNSRGMIETITRGFKFGAETDFVKTSLSGM